MGALGKQEKTQAEVIRAIKASKGLISLTAQKLDISVKALRQRIDANPELRELIIVERESMIDLAEGKLMQAIQAGEPWAITLALKTVGRGRGYTENTTATVAIQNTMVQTTLGDDSKAQILDLVERARLSALKEAN